MYAIANYLFTCLKECSSGIFCGPTIEISFFMSVDEAIDLIGERATVVVDSFWQVIVQFSQSVNQLGKFRFFVDVIRVQRGLNA